MECRWWYGEIKVIHIFIKGTQSPTFCTEKRMVMFLVQGSWGKFQKQPRCCLLWDCVAGVRVGSAPAMGRVVLQKALV